MDLHSRSDRRRLLVAVALAAVVALAGCAGGGGNDGPIVASGEPATVDADARSATGYERVAATERSFNVTVSAEVTGDVEMSAMKKVVTTVPVRTYTRETEAGRAVVGVVSSPAVQPISNVAVFRDPFAELSTVEQVEVAQDEYDVRGLSKVGRRNVSVFGNETTLRTYEGTAGGTEVTVHVLSVRHGGDYVHVVAVWPAGVDDTDRLHRLLAGLSHAKE